MKTCIECGAPVNDDGAYINPFPPTSSEPEDLHAVDYQHPCFICGSVISHDHSTAEWVAAQAMQVHGYTCGICSWGRANQPRTAEDYKRHMIAAHSHCDPKIDYHANPHIGCILR